MPAAAEKFLPQPTPVSKPYWDACRKHQLLIQRCAACGHHQFYPRTVCAACGRAAPDWVQSSGRGAVMTWTVVRRPVSEAYADETPYVIALVRLDEGPVMMSQITACDPERIESGMRVKVVFEAWSDEITMPKFAPLSNPG